MNDHKKAQIPLRLALLLLALLATIFAVVGYWAKVAKVNAKIPPLRGMPLSSPEKTKREAQTRRRLKNVAKAWRSHYGAKRPGGIDKRSLAGLNQAGKLNRSELKDAWGRLIRVTYRSAQDASYLRFASPGSDGRFGTFDDLNNDDIDVPR